MMHDYVTNEFHKAKSKAMTYFILGMETAEMISFKTVSNVMSLYISITG